MSIKHASLSIKAPPTAWANELRGIDGIHVRIFNCLPQEDGSVLHLINVETPDRETAEHVKQVLKSSKAVEEAFFAEGTATNVIGFVKTKKCTVCGSFANRCFVRGGTYDVKRDRIVWKLIVLDREIPGILSALESKGVAVEMLESVEARNLDPNGVSAHLLTTALAEGYFDVPRKVTTHQLARMLGKTPATLSITLRRNVKKILTHYVNVYAMSDIPHQ